MADKGSKYDLGGAIFLVHTEMQAQHGGGFWGRIFSGVAGLKANLRARADYRRPWGKAGVYGSEAQKVYVCLNPEWIEISEKDLDAWKDYDDARIQAEVERIRALHGAVPTEQQENPKA